jgi:hypothetical protein
MCVHVHVLGEAGDNEKANYDSHIGNLQSVNVCNNPVGFFSPPLLTLSWF